MWSELTNFGFKRTKKQAFGFYLAYLVLVMLIGFVIGAAAGTIAPEASGGFEGGLRIGSFVALISSLVISYLVVREKKLISFGYILLIVLSGALAVVGGGVFGFVVPAVLTTKTGK